VKLYGLGTDALITPEFAFSELKIFAKEAVLHPACPEVVRT
jgi:hypothetical protein